MKQIFKYAMALLMVVAVASCGRDEAPAGKNGVNGINGKDGRDGKNGTDGTKILSGTGTPAESLGNVGDFYLDKDTRNLYGPKTANGWGEGISLGGNTISLRGDYILSKDGTILVSWLNKEITEIDMESNPELRNVKVIGSDAFRNSELQQIILPDGLKKIGRSAFINSRLNFISIPNDVTSIGVSAFSDNQLTSVKIGNSVTTIGHGAFSSNQLTSVTIPNSVTSIGDHAFRYNQLTSVKIGNGITTIGDAAFDSNYPHKSKITLFVIDALVPPTIGGVSNPLGIKRGGYDHYLGNTYLGVIYVPNQSVDAYKQANGWSEYADMIKPISEKPTR